jgi:hypothetical protein
MTVRLFGHLPDDVQDDAVLVATVDPVALVLLRVEVVHEAVLRQDALHVWDVLLQHEQVHVLGVARSAGVKREGEPAAEANGTPLPSPSR